MKHTHTLTARITTATASTSALFALQHFADAAIVYRGGLNMVLTAPAGGGTAKGTIHMEGVGGTIFPQADIIFGSSGSNHRAFIFAGSKDQWLGAGPNVSAGNYFLRKLAKGAQIGPSLAPWNPPSIRGGKLRSASAAFQGGSWTTGQKGFAAVRLAQANGGYDYGWIQMSFDDTNNDGFPDTLTVYDWAYETSENTPIAAGAGELPEPSSIALLALAGSGAAFLRRKRASAGIS